MKLLLLGFALAIIVIPQVSASWTNSMNYRFSNIFAAPLPSPIPSPGPLPTTESKSKVGLIFSPTFHLLSAGWVDERGPELFSLVDDGLEIALTLRRTNSCPRLLLRPALQRPSNASLTVLVLIPLDTKALLW